MKIILISICLYCCALLNAQLTLTIVIDQCENNKGRIALVLEDEEENEIKSVTAEIKEGKCTITLPELEAGKYVFKYFHDENSNDKLDTNIIGMPKEGFGFSNNAKGKFGPPAHEDTIFILDSDTTVHCAPLYF